MALLFVLVLDGRIATPSCNAWQHNATQRNVLGVRLWRKTVFMFSCVSIFSFVPSENSLLTATTSAVPPPCMTTAMTVGFRPHSPFPP